MSTKSPTKAGLVIPRIAVILFLILTILIIIVIPSIMGAIAIAQRAKTYSDVYNIKTAIIAYSSDYGSLPIPTGAKFLPGGDVVLGTPPGADPSDPPAPGTKEFFQSLCGNMNSYSAIETSSATTGVNKRNTAYLTLRNSQVDKDGIFIQGFKSKSGSPLYFGIMLDANSDGELYGLPDCSAGTFTLKIEDSAAVWSNNDQPYTVPNNHWSITYRTMAEAGLF